jgi:hypothetical protein
MGERVLTPRELNRALLARQLLLDGLQTHYAPSGYVGLWSRLESFARDDLGIGLGSTWSARRRREPGNAGGPISSPPPRGGRLSRETRRELDGEAERLAAFHA